MLAISSIYDHVVGLVIHCACLTFNSAMERNRNVAVVKGRTKSVIIAPARTRGGVCHQSLISLIHGSSRRSSRICRIPYKRTLDFLKTRMVQLESFINSHGLIAPEVCDDDSDVYDKLAPSLQALRDIYTRSRSLPDPDHLLSVDSVSVLPLSPSQSRANDPKACAGTVLHVEDVNENVEAQGEAAVASEKMDDWLADIMNMTDGPALSGDGDDFQAPSLDWDNVLSSQPVSGSLNEIEGLSPTVSGRRSGVSSAPVNAEPKTASCHHEFPDDDDELVLQLSNRMGDLHLTNGGMSRFYGATSNFNFARWRSSLGVNHHQHVAEHAELEHDLSEDAALSVEKDLEELYFCWQDSAFHAIDRDMYQHGKKLWHEQQKSSTFYSPLLKNAM